MHKRMVAVAICIAGFAMSAAAQNTFPATGNVGIGTTSPASLLHLQTTGSVNAFSMGADGTNYGYFQIQRKDTGNGMGYVNFIDNYGGTQMTWGAYSSSAYVPLMSLTGIPYASLATTWQISSASAVPIVYFTNGGASYINTGGNVGIGTTSPAAKLDVNGSINISGPGGSITFPNGGGTQSAAWTGTLCGGDYAESVDVSGDRSQYQPGDVMIADPDHDGKFLKSAEPYSTAIMGVYSTKPGALGRRQTTPKIADEVPMAMIGIVPTKVSAENGAVKPGDLLVTSSTPGYAMKGTDRSLLVGAVIGKALGHLDAGKGVIEVGVTLQ